MDDFGWVSVNNGSNHKRLLMFDAVSNFILSDVYIIRKKKYRANMVHGLITTMRRSKSYLQTSQDVFSMQIR